MYSIYVTNKTNSEDLYIRLQHEKISTVNPSFHNDLDKLNDDNVFSYLIRWGFCLIPAQHTMPFAIDVANDGNKKYASLYANYKLWTMDCEMNCIRYGCLFAKWKSLYPQKGKTYYLNQASPKPVWIPAKKEDILPPNIIKAGLEAYFGRSNGGTPCRVTVLYNKQLNWETDVTCPAGELLQDTGHEFVPAKTGDIVPPHAVIGGVSEPEGSLYLGRVGGKTPCSITTEGGKIKSFCYSSKKVQSGEMLILTNDQSI